MPELVEVEAYRRLAERALDRPIVDVRIGDLRFLRPSTSPAALADTLAGGRFTAARRHGKLLVLELRHGGAADEVGHRLGLRFGMTGRLLVDGAHAVDRLLYASERVEPRWDRVELRFEDGGSLVVCDPRLLGSAELDPDESRLGPDALTVTAAQLRAALDGSAAPLKARLMDQHRLAGVGNLIADETLWRAGLRPGRPAGSIDAGEHRRLHRHLHGTLVDLVERGGSHTGDLMAARAPGVPCPRCGSPLRRDRVGGRTTIWCPAHQR